MVLQALGGAAPAIISAAGSALGGLGSVFGAFGGSDPPGGMNIGQMLYLQRHGRREYAADFRENARQMGVSPLALLGHSLPGTPAIPMQRQPKVDKAARVGKAMQRMGQDVHRGVQAHMAYETHKENIKETRARTKYYDALATKALNDPTQNPPDAATATGQVNVVPQRIPSASPVNPGVGAGGRSSKFVFVDEFGGVNIMPNQELSEALESQGIVDYSVQQLRDAIRALDRNVNMGLRNKLRDTVIAELKRTGGIKPWQTIKWDKLLQQFLIVPIDNRLKKSHGVQGRRLNIPEMSRYSSPSRFPDYPVDERWR